MIKVKQGGSTFWVNDPNKIKFYKMLAHASKNPSVTGRMYLTKILQEK